MLPGALREALEGHLRERKAQHAADLAADCGSVALPTQLRITYPSAPFEWGFWGTAT